ncbi:MAG: flagellar biosynthetic protein FliR [Magnetococcales bacterium]|nr:flagellar biosynthetic protein FliR [Magnetococcales bacterium]
MDPAALMDLLGLSIGELERMALILSRLTGLFLSAPFFSRNVGPMRVRVVILLGLTFMIYPLTDPWPGEGSSSPMVVVAAGVAEVVIGAALGMLVHWALVAVQVAGGVIGFSMGLSMAMVMDPTSGMQEGVLSNMLYMATLLLFLGVDGHHMLIEGLARSFHTLPLGAGIPEGRMMLEAALVAMGQMFALSIMIAAPVLVATKMLYFGMGLINRASPQIQVFFLAMPVAQLVGFVVLGLSMAVFAQVMIREIDKFFSLSFRIVGL